MWSLKPHRSFLAIQTVLSYLTIIMITRPRPGRRKMINNAIKAQCATGYNTNIFACLRCVAYTHIHLTCFYCYFLFHPYTHYHHYCREGEKTRVNVPMQCSSAQVSYKIIIITKQNIQQCIPFCYLLVPCVSMKCAYLQTDFLWELKTLAVEWRVDHNFNLNSSTLSGLEL